MTGGAKADRGTEKKPVARRVTVGRVVKPVGLKGEIKIVPLTDNPDRFVKGGKVWMESPDGEPTAFKILAAQFAGGDKGIIRLLLAGISSVEEAEGYRGRELFVPENEVPPLPEGEYYHFQILGLEVYTHSGRLLGKVDDIFPAGEKDVYSVKGEGGKEYLIPVTDDTLDTIDVKAGRITLFRMDGYIPED